MDNSPPETGRPSPKSRFTRRSFLITAALGGAAFAAKPALDALGTAATNWIKAGESSLPFLAEYSLEQLGSPAAREILVSEAQKLDKASRQIIQSDPRISTLPEEERKKLALPNEHLRPIDEIILEAIRGYDGKITFQKYPDFKPLSFWASFITKEGSKLQLKDTWDKLDAMIPDSQIQKFVRYSRDNAASYVDFLLPSKSSFFSEIEVDLFWTSDNSPELVINAARNNPDRVTKVATFWRVAALRHLFDFIYQQTPSASRLLTYFLSKNRGRLDCALWDTCIFLKMTARNDFDGTFISQAPDPKKSALDTVDYTSAYCLDEYSISLNYNYLRNAMFGIGIQAEDENTELSALNRVGAPYHAFNDVALLTVFPAEVVIAGVVGDQIRNRNWQGPAKIASDLLVAARLSELEKYFTSIPQS